MVVVSANMNFEYCLMCNDDYQNFYVSKSLFCIFFSTHPNGWVFIMPIRLVVYEKRKNSNM